MVRTLPLFDRDVHTAILASFPTGTQQRKPWTETEGQWKKKNEPQRKLNSTTHRKKSVQKKLEGSLGLLNSRCDEADSSPLLSTTPQSPAPSLVIWQSPLLILASPGSVADACVDMTSTLVAPTSPRELHGMGCVQYAVRVEDGWLWVAVGVVVGVSLLRLWVAGDGADVLVNGFSAKYMIICASGSRWNRLTRIQDVTPRRRFTANTVKSCLIPGWSNG